MNLIVQAVVYHQYCTREIFKLSCVQVRAIVECLNVERIVTVQFYNSNHFTSPSSVGYKSNVDQDCQIICVMHGTSFQPYWISERRTIFIFFKNHVRRSLFSLEPLYIILLTNLNPVIIYMGPVTFLERRHV
jgi:hypothetical protein